MSQPSRAATKRQKRLEQKAENKHTSLKPQNFELRSIYPKTENQTKVFDAFDSGNHLFLHGAPGTGKTFLSLYLALREVFDEKTKLNRVVIVRASQPAKNIGFLPGSEKQKMEVYEAPYKAICSELFNRADAYDVLKNKGLIEFHSTSYLRGTTIDDSVIILDEIQNNSYQESKTILTRAGNNSRIIACGDGKQDDLTSTRFNEISGLSTLRKVFDRIPSIELIEFSVEDIVRSGFVKEFIIAELELT